MRVHGIQLTDGEGAVYRALQDGPKSTNDLEDNPGGRYTARLGGLRDKGIGWDKRWDKRLGQWIYYLTGVIGGAGTPAAPPAGTGGGSGGAHVDAFYRWPGPHNVCCHCSWRWTEPGSSTECPNCHAGAHWIEEHVAKGEADRRAKEIDPAKVADELEYLARARRDRERAHLSVAA